VKKKRKWFSITAKDFDWQPYKGTGAGGQKKNKTSSAMRCKHPPSGAVGKCEDHRQQRKNKTEAFKRCVETPEFQGWLKGETEIGLGNVKMEVRKEGSWVDKTIVGDLKLKR